MKRIFRYTTIILLAFSISPASAWRSGISAGYGYGQEVGANYDNSGFYAQAILYRFNKIDQYLIFMIDTSIGFWHASTMNNNRLVALALSPAFRAYFVNPETHRVRPYLQISFGPSYFSNKILGTQAQGSHFLFQSTLGGGIEFKLNQKNQALDLSGMLIHYCNAGLYRPNEGTDIPIVITLGYLF